MTSNGEPFHFLPTAPDVLFCKGSPPMNKVIMTLQPDSPQSASKRRQTSGSAAPRVPTKKRKIIARRVIKKTTQPSPNQLESNTNQVIHSSETSFLRIYILVDCNPIFRTQLVWMATGKIHADTDLVDPHPQVKIQARTRNPPRVQSNTRTRYPRIPACPRVRPYTRKF